MIKILNHFDNNYGICTKTGIVRSLNNYYKNIDEASIYI
jgi:hypothetical protein